MFWKTKGKEPVGNLGFEVTVDSKKAVMSLSQVSNGEHPVKLADLLVTFGKALENGRKYLASNNFQILEDGSLLAQPPLALLPDSILVIDLMDAFNLNALQGFEEAVNARKIRKGSDLWRVTGYWRGSENSMEHLVMDERGQLYLHGPRRSWKSTQELRFVGRDTRKGWSQ